MKKLMITAAAAALAGGAFAAPLVYDYQASVKHMYLKEKAVTAYDGNNYTLYLKVVRSANLKGYLVMDQDGVTSPTITAADPTPCTATGFDYGRNRGFLVVKSTTVRENEAQALNNKAKIIPAVLDAKWIDQRYDAAKMPVTGLAEGSLFLGGDSIACVRTQLDEIAGVITDRAAAPAAPAVATPGMVAYADYVWTSIYLFGNLNGPNWFEATPAAGNFDNFEAAWDAGLPADLQVAWPTPNDKTVIPYVHPYFHDTWMNGAGFGKYVKPKDEVKQLCCGITGTTNWDIIVDTLSGAVKGGLFLCTENAIIANVKAYQFFDGDTWRWENQFNTARLVPGATFADGYQNDMWQDGAVEQEVTDVMSGSWSIKYNSKFLTKSGVYVDPTAVDVTRMTAGAITSVAGLANDELRVLIGCLKSAQIKLDGVAANFCDGTEIHAITQADVRALANGSKRLPLITPQFVKYYGLAY